MCYTFPNISCLDRVCIKDAPGRLTSVWKQPLKKCNILVWSFIVEIQLIYQFMSESWHEALHTDVWLDELYLILHLEPRTVWYRAKFTKFRFSRMYDCVNLAVFCMLCIRGVALFGNMVQQRSNIKYLWRCKEVIVQRSLRTLQLFVYLLWLQLLLALTVWH